MLVSLLFSLISEAEKRFLKIGLPLLAADDVYTNTVEMRQLTNSSYIKITYR